MNFNRLAPWYDLMEDILAGSLLEKARAALLDELDGCRSVLSVGEGHGRFAAMYARRFPAGTLVCVEESARMIRQAQQRLHAIGRSGRPVARVVWNHATVEAWQPPPQKFAGVVTCFFLDCFTADGLAAIVEKLSRRAEKDARWIIVDFALPARGPRRVRAQAIHQIMYTFFRAAVSLPARRLTPPDSLLLLHGFHRARKVTFSWGLLSAELWVRRSAN
jgi:ubiquinone/menaquinone biosynthesis C-methylase UbiE